MVLSDVKIFLHCLQCYFSFTELPWKLIFCYLLEDSGKMELNVPALEKLIAVSYCDQGSSLYS